MTIHLESAASHAANAPTTPTIPIEPTIAPTVPISSAAPLRVPAEAPSSLSLGEGGGRGPLFSLYIQPLIPAIRQRVAFLSLHERDVDDNLQEVLIHLFLNIDRYDPSQALPATWINTVVTRKMLLMARRPERTDDDLPANDAPIPLPIEENWEGIPCLDALVPLDRTIIILHAEGVPVRDIAEEVGLSPDVVSRRLYRIKARLRTELQDRHDLLQKAKAQTQNRCPTIPLYPEREG